MKTNNLALAIAVTSSLLFGCGSNETAANDKALAQQVSDALIQSCPMAAPNDENARALCAANLSDNKFLGSVMAETFQWGGQSTAGDYDFANSNMNRFNVFVWRRMYLSLLMFPGDMSIEQIADGTTLVHLSYQFRNQLDIGSYPYPFWHSAKKWTSYQQAKEIILEFKGGKWLGALRSADQDASLPKVAHTWSGQWHWERGGQEMPYVSLYTYLLSPNNPSTARLDSAYRALSDGMRQQSCLMCHSPDNYAANKQLEFFNYPNQALYARSDIVVDLQKNIMPPVDNTLGLTSGIASDSDRQELITLAQEFKAAGDAALAFEGEVKTAH